MHTQPSRRSPSTIETLESRTLLSAAAFAGLLDTAAPTEQSAIVRDVKTPKRVTKTTLAVHAGTLGQPIEFDVTVKAAAQFGSPVGTVTIFDHGSAIQTLNLTAGASTNPKFDVSTATFTIPGGAGGTPYFFGHHQVSATFNSANTLLTSKGKGVIVIKKPKYARHSDGLKVATVVTGSGAAIQAGQTATMMYTGYLANGTIFDNSGAHSPGTFNFQVFASPEQVITGFDEGTVGMEVGDTRILAIPSRLGYGPQGSGSIPPNANLVFLVTLVAIS